MFYHGFEGYMKNAYPLDELDPIGRCSCNPRNFETKSRKGIFMFLSFNIGEKPSFKSKGT